MRPLMLLVLTALTTSSQSNLTLVRTIDLQGDTHHVQGIDFDERHVWVTSVDKEQRKGYLQEFSMAAAPGVLIGANWDSRDFYVWDRTGRLLRKVPNPTANAYQDIKFVDGHLVASGLLPGRKGAIDWLEYPSLNLIRRVTVGQTSRGVPYTSEGMAVRGDRLFLLPEDSPSRLFQFSFTVPEVPARK